MDHILILTQTGLLLNSSVADICKDYSFEYRPAGSDMSDVVYAEPSLQGNAVMVRRREGSAETQLNLELLFDAVISGKVK